MAEFWLKVTRKIDDESEAETIFEQPISVPSYSPGLDRTILLCMAEELKKIAEKYPSEENE